VRSIATIREQSACAAASITVGVQCPLPGCFPLMNVQVEGCEADLRVIRDLLLENRVCESHARMEHIMIGGCQQRFCQQCSRLRLPGTLPACHRSYLYEWPKQSVGPEISPCCSEGTACALGRSSSSCSCSCSKRTML